MTVRTALTDAARTRIAELVAEAPPASPELVAKIGAILASAPDVTAAGPAPPGPAANAFDPQPAKELSRAHRTSAA
jgi:hypothetical protein